LSARDLGFRLANRLNAAGRMGDSDPAIKLLICKEPSLAWGFAHQLEDLNRERRSIEQLISAEAIQRVEQSPALEEILILSGEEWHLGVLGIVASRLVERFQRPAILLGRDGDRYKGSARSLSGLDIKSILDKVSEHLERYGGHSAAVGLSLSVEALPAFKAAIRAELKQPRPLPQKLRKRSIDAEINLTQIRPWEIKALERLAPFGEGNPPPLLLARGVKAQSCTLRGGHLKFKIPSAYLECEALGWNMANRWSLTEGAIDLLFNPSLEYYRGRQKLILRIKDLRPTRGLG